MERRNRGRKGKNKPRNYRARRRSLSILDVRLRPSVRKRIVLRKLGIYAIPVVLLGLVIWAGTLLLPRLVQPEVLDDPEYTLRSISVETDGTVSRERILQIAGVREGQNIFEAELKAIHDRLMAHAQFRDAEVRRELPDKLSIAVSERRPVALVAPATREMGENPESIPPVEWMVDRSGVLLELDESVAEFGSLPVILVRSDPALRPGHSLQREEVTQAIALIELINNQMQAGLYRIVLIDTFRGYALDAIGESGTRVTFGRSQLKEQVARLARFLEFSDDTGQKLASVNLMVERNTPARYGEPPEVPLRPLRRASVAPPTAAPAASGTPEVRRAVPVQSGNDDPNLTSSSPFQQATSAAESFTDGER